MDISELFSAYSKHPLVADVRKALAAGRNVVAEGLVGSARSMALAAVFAASKDDMFVVANDEESAAYLFNDMTHMLGAEQVLYFPSSFRNISKGKVDSINEVMRTEVLNRLSQVNGSRLVIVTYPEALVEKVIPSSSLRKKILTLTKGEEVDTHTVIDILLENGFERVDFVYEPGQFSSRGSILDIFSYSNELPFRIDFFGNEIDSIRLFNIETQLSEEMRESVSIVPDIRREQKGVTPVPVLQFVKESSVFAFDDLIFSCDVLNKVYESKHNLMKTEVEKDKEAYINGDDFLQFVSGFRKIELNHGSHMPNSDRVAFSTQPQPLYHKNFDLVIDGFRSYIAENKRIFVLSDSVKQTDRIRAIFDDKGVDIQFTPVLHTVHSGFVDNDMNICVFTDHEIFDRFHRYSLKSDKARNGKVLLTLKELNQFKIGDYVTHIDHGVGRFGGLVNMDVNGKKQEVIKLIYQNNDIIFVNINNLHRISRYKGKDGTPPKVSRLGSGAWEKLKDRTKKKVKDIARDLIKLYARRKAEKGFAFSPDSFLQKELEASFIYEDTPDQMKATADVKADMEKSLPMDRLVCGDVGFGKTEVAMRAAFKAVTDNKQVAVLVPTTVLALQHYKSFKERLRNFPCNIEYLSRARTAAQTKDVLKRLAEGQIDIIIGTHKLVGKNVKFKDLGLLIIDEEQKFGVAVKEKLKAIKVNVDTLTMTATPIPRTLQFSLLGARDLSIISTPPPNRYPVQTELQEFNTDVLKEAIEREMSRNGQVFIINNRINNIYDLESLVKSVVPQARVVVGHGQMEAEKLEQIIVDFMDYEYDVLIATTIIESGIDIPNANTIIINGAQNYGLSDLHQLRGRVGRSNRKAYCYLLSPPMSTLTPEARRRLQAIETFADLGSGFQIAMQDLDIRGAGNMLGAEQSGFIADLGYETYQKILSEAVHELKDEEFAYLYEDEKAADDANAKYVTDCSLESDLEMLIPADYVESISERMSLYRELDNLTEESQIDAFEKRLADRFGPVPDNVRVLFSALRLRWIAMSLGFERVVLKNGRMSCYLVSNAKSQYYQSPVFGAVLMYVAKNPMRCKLKEKADRRSVSFSDVSDVPTALGVLERIRQLQTEKTAG